ncbi:MAG: hypothetical protein AB7O98_15960 [Hyphomonadaceae bacterium]
MLRGLGNHGSGWARALTALALLAMAVRALIPAGYMLDAPAQGRFFTVTICSGHGDLDLVFDRQTGEMISADDAQQRQQDGQNKTNDGGPCVFAAVAMLSAPESAPDVARVRHAIDAPNSLARDIFPGRGLAAPPPWATGPPQTV